MSRRSGMTLVEVMLAMALFAMLSLFVLSVVNSVLGLWQSGERRGNGDLAFSAVAARVRVDLAALHTGPSGWLIMDEYEAWPAENSNSPWMLPRLRFLARGASLPMDDPSGRSAVEIAWVVVPVDAAESRVTRLVRLTQLAEGQNSLQDNRHLSAMIQGGNGAPMLEGVLHLNWQMFDVDGEISTSDNVPAETPFDFPAQLKLTLERVAPESQKRPLVLDDDLSPSATGLNLRGNPPLRTPSHVLVDLEWIAVQGEFPKLRVVERGSRGTVPVTHHRGDVALAPNQYQSSFHVTSQGRRMMP
jgi:prepilin-type N-terminal cleavage/methylation domain-containing protein